MIHSYIRESKAAISRPIWFKMKWYIICFIYSSKFNWFSNYPPTVNNRFCFSYVALCRVDRPAHMPNLLRLESRGVAFIFTCNSSDKCPCNRFSSIWGSTRSIWSSTLQPWRERESVAVDAANCDRESDAWRHAPASFPKAAAAFGDPLVLLGGPKVYILS